MNFKFVLPFMLTICASLHCGELLAQTGNFSEVNISSGNVPRLYFLNSASFSDVEWQFSRFGNTMHIRKNLDTIVKLGGDSPQGTLSTGELGVGIGTSLPSEALHVYSDDFFKAPFHQGFDQARILVENRKAETRIRTMMELVNNGGSRLVFENTNTDEAWAVLNGAADQFIVSRGGTGGAEFVIRKDGAVFMGPGNQSNFILARNGNLTIKGALNQQSDRNAKTAFGSVDVTEVLDKVAELPISTWQYKDDQASVRHIGPTAQDFSEAFGLGSDDKTIATVDADGVALAAIQALHQKLKLKEQEIAILKEQLRQSDEATEFNNQRIADLEAAFLSFSQRQN